MNRAPERVTAPFLLFIPSYGGGGSGEFVRSVIFAQAAARRWAQARIEFLLPSGPGTRTDAPFPSQIHAGPADDKSRFDQEWIAGLRPDVAVFDSGCRTDTLRLCRQLGIRTVYISDRYGTRRKAFRIEWLRRLDQHWLMREHVTAQASTPGQRFKHRCFGRTRLVSFDTYYPEIEPDAAALAAALDGTDGNFVLLSAGGGGYRIGGVQASDLYCEAARRIAAAGTACLVLLGPLYQGEPQLAPGMRALHRVDGAVFVELLRRARAEVINGGHTMHQALAQRAVVVAAALGGGDQPARIAAYARGGLVCACPPEPAAIAAAVQDLLQRPQLAAAMRERVQAVQVSNGVPVVLEALADLLRPAAAPAA